MKQEQGTQFRYVNQFTLSLKILTIQQMADYGFQT